MKLPFPVTPKLRIAEISAVPSVQGARGIPYEQWPELATQRPSVLVGTVSELQLLMENMDRRKLDVSSVDRAIVVLTYSCSKPMDDVVRVTLWQTFGVPVYELLVGPNNTLLAAECEANDGWHVQPDVEVFFADGELVCAVRSHHPVEAGWVGRLERQPCACGRTSARLLDLELASRTNVRKLAATA